MKKLFEVIFVWPVVSAINAVQFMCQVGTAIGVGIFIWAAMIGIPGYLITELLSINARSIGWLIFAAVPLGIGTGIWLYYDEYVKGKFVTETPLRPGDRMQDMLVGSSADEE